MVESVPATTARQVSFVEWGAVFAGALIAAAISFVLYTFGTTIGLSFVSPWANARWSPTLIAAIAAFWLMISQIGSFLVGGYVAGRMRSRWGEAQSQEIEFRDGLHGGLVWALGVVIGAGLLLAAAISVTRGAAELGSRGAGAAASSASSQPLDYYADLLLRPQPGAPVQAASGNAPSRDEMVRILQKNVAMGRMPDADKAYLTQVIAQRTGLAPPAAQKRVDDTFAEATRTTREGADKVRKGAVLTGLLTAISLLIALAASWWAAQRGGHHRDHAVHVSLLGEKRWPASLQR